MRAARAAARVSGRLFLKIRKSSAPRSDPGGPEECSRIEKKKCRAFSPNFDLPMHWRFSDTKRCPETTDGTPFPRTVRALGFDNFARGEHLFTFVIRLRLCLQGVETSLVAKL